MSDNDYEYITLRQVFCRGTGEMVPPGEIIDLGDADARALMGCGAVMAQVRIRVPRTPRPIAPPRVENVEDEAEQALESKE